VTAKRKRMTLNDRKPKRGTRSVRFSEEEEKLVEAKAATVGRKFGAFVRYAALNFKPGPKDLIPTK
jgi:hypothetical protein